GRARGPGHVDAHAGRARRRRGDLLRALPAGADRRGRPAPLQALRLRRLVPIPRRTAGDRRPRRRAPRTGGFPDRVAERRTHRRPVVGSVGGRGDRAGRRPRAHRRPRVQRGVRGRPSGDPLRPRHRGEADRPGGGGPVRAHADAERRSRLTRRAGGRGPRPSRFLAGRGAVTSRPARVAVVGGGVSGLTAALRLLAEGRPIEVVVFETEDRAGGKIRSVEVGGLRLPAGADSFVARKPWAVDLCRELGLGAELVAPAARAAFLWTDHGLEPFPRDAPFGIPGDVGDVLRWPGLSRAGRARAAKDLVMRTRSPDEDESLGSLLRRRLGDEAADVAVAPLLEGLFAGDADRLSVRATFPELVEWERTQGSLIRGSQAATRNVRRGEAGPMFLKPRGGVDRLTDALAGRLGARVRSGASVTRIGADDDRYRVEVG